MNVYETLVSYNGTDVGPNPSDFFPDGATCVPGTAECLAQTGSTLVFNNRTTGLPQYYSFEIDAGARFYDGKTGISWPVYPTDVMFSLARTMAFSLVPGPQVYNGWINSQDLLPVGNPRWDGGLHGTYNTTPGHILNALLINDSAYCPDSNVPTNGCVTFNTGASGRAWPFFLELVADPMGASIQSCGAMTYLGGGVPGWVGSSAVDGDGPCQLPDGGTSTNNTDWTSYITNLSNSRNATGWDAFEKLGYNYPSPQAGVQWNMIGSGPYYSINPVNPNVGYLLRENPAYQSPVGCREEAGCVAIASPAFSEVNVYWETGDTIPIEEALAGVSDSSEFAASDIGEFCGSSASDQCTSRFLLGTAGLSIFFDPFALNFSVSAVEKTDPVGGLNLAGNFLSNVAIRQFLVKSFPYHTDLATLETDDGVAFGEHYGGVPTGIGGASPTSVAWPGPGDPEPNSSVVGNVSWWWNELTTPGTPWYNASFARCSDSSPCRFPMTGERGDTQVVRSEDNWLSSVTNLSGGRVVPYQFTDCQCCTACPIQPTTEPIYSYGWSPDYPDVSDYTEPMFAPNQTYTYPDAVESELSLPKFLNATDPRCSAHTLPGTPANLTYWSSIGEIPNDCQGFAYAAIEAVLSNATYLPDLTVRGTELTEALSIANELALYLYWYQSTVPIEYADWIDPSGINTNPMIGGNADQLWAFWRGANESTVTFSESGLPSGTHWTVNLAGSGSEGSNGTGIEYLGVPPGDWTYDVGFEPGYGVSPASGSVSLPATAVSVVVNFTALSTPREPVSFDEQGLESGTPYGFTVDGVGSFFGNTTLTTLELPAGIYRGNATNVTGYLTPVVGSSGEFAVFQSPVSIALQYRCTGRSTYPVVFAAGGLPYGQNWSVTIDGFSNISSTPLDVFWEPNGTYNWSAGDVPSEGWLLSGTPAVVAGGGVVVNISWPASVGPEYLLTFVEGGLPSGTEWSVSLDGRTVGSSSPYFQVLVGNGTFDWSANVEQGYLASPSSGSVTVAGRSPPSIAIEFQGTGGPLYSVSFTVAGAAISNWSIFIAAQTYTFAGLTGSVSLALGAYSWGIQVPRGYEASPSGGVVNVAISGAQVVIEIQSTLCTACVAPSTLPSGSLPWILVGVLAATSVGLSFAWGRRVRRNRSSSTHSGDPPPQRPA